MKEEIIEGNKLIAEFMGWKVDGFWWAQPNGTRYNSQPDFTYYHSSWNALMPVVDKIEDIDSMIIDIQIDGWVCEIRWNNKAGEPQHILMTSSENKIECAWLAVVDFIKWYNTNQKIKC